MRPVGSMAASATPNRCPERTRRIGMGDRPPDPGRHAPRHAGEVVQVVERALVLCRDLDGNPLKVRVKVGGLGRQIQEDGGQFGRGDPVGHRMVELFDDRNPIIGEPGNEDELPQWAGSIQRPRKQTHRTAGVAVPRSPEWGAGTLGHGDRCRTTCRPPTSVAPGATVRRAPFAGVGARTAVGTKRAVEGRQAEELRSSFSRDPPSKDPDGRQVHRRPLVLEKQESCIKRSERAVDRHGHGPPSANDCRRAGCVVEHVLRDRAEEHACCVAAAPEYQRRGSRPPRTPR